MLINSRKIGYLLWALRTTLKDAMSYNASLSEQPTLSCSPVTMYVVAGGLTVLLVVIPLLS